MWWGRAGLRLGRMSSYVQPKTTQRWMNIRQQRREHDDGISGRNDQAGEQRHPRASEEERAQGDDAVNMARTNAEGFVYGLLRERPGDQRDVARLLPGRAGI